MAEKDIVGGIFGLTPEMYQRGLAAKDTATNLAAAQLAPGQLAGYYAMEAGSGLGRAVPGLLGVEDPELAKIRDVQSMRGQFDLSTPTGMRQFAKALSDKGYGDLAVQASARAADIDKEIAAAEKARTEKLPNIANLQLYRDRLVQAVGPNDPRVQQVDAVIKAEGEGKAPKVNVAVQGQKNVLEIDKKAAENLQKMEESSSTVIERLQEQKQALEKGIIGGQFSDARTAFANSLAAFGIKDKKTMEMLADTKRFNTNRIELASSVAKQLGVNPTDRDFQASLSRFANASDDPGVSLQFVNDMLTIANKQNTQAREGLDYFRRNDGSFAGYQKPLPKSAIVEAAATDRLSQLKAEQAKRNKQQD